MINRQFVLAGKALFTLELPATFSQQHNLPPHYTFKVAKKEATDRYPEAYFVSLLTGPNNEEDYSYLGMLDKEAGIVRLTKASKLTQESYPVRLLQRVVSILFGISEREMLAGLERMTQAGFNLHHEGKCCRCGRTLTTPESVTSGIGPECRKKV